MMRVARGGSGSGDPLLARFCSPSLLAAAARSSLPEQSIYSQVVTGPGCDRLAPPPLMLEAALLRKTGEAAPSGYRACTVRISSRLVLDDGA
mmetsp:Transcript_11428/g.24741  ORF Transcript_11428/g.24741 Transcript_11428/m.24741 type:complete len:92 (-) Transcript_11428:26-301(-)